MSLSCSVAGRQHIGMTRIHSLDIGEKAAMVVLNFNLEFTFEEVDSAATEDSGDLHHQNGCDLFLQKGK